VVSLEGPVGTLSSFSSNAIPVRKTASAHLGLTAPPTPWHTLRARPAEAGAWLAILVGTLAKMAADVDFLASTEVGEVAEPHETGRGGSSAMPHKQNPVSSTIILAAHAAAGGLLVTLVNAMSARNQRPTGAWHSEWHCLPQLFGLASGALREARRLADGLTVDKARMRANLDLTQGLVFAGEAGDALAPRLGREAAHRTVQKAAETVRKTGQPLQDVLTETQDIPLEKLSAAFDLTPSIDAAAAVTDRILAEMRRPRRGR
jgi:3-carboxy-cis,cis-muconate cycloisomerase